MKQSSSRPQGFLSYNSLFIVALYASVLLLCSALPQRKTKALCTVEERQKSSCKCCKVDCWFKENDLWRAAHGDAVPGSSGEGEAMEVLENIFACVELDCSEFCAPPKAFLIRR